VKEYLFSTSRYPNNSYHLPLDATLTLSDNAVASGIATGNDILSIKITAGQALPASSPMTFAEYHSAFLNPTVTLSSDRKSVTAISADNADGGQWSFWVFFQTFHQTPAGKVENVVKVRADSIDIESDVLPTPQTIFSSQFGGSWLVKEERPQKNPLEIATAHMLAIDPLALILANDVYVRLTLPDPPPIEVIHKYVRERISKMSDQEFKRAYARVKEMKALADNLAIEFEKHKG
jgi:hypothetical protein